MSEDAAITTMLILVVFQYAMSLWEERRFKRIIAEYRKDHEAMEELRHGQVRRLTVDAYEKHKSRTFCAERLHGGCTWSGDPAVSLLNNKGA